jgi:hypothetical protein
MLAAPTSLFLGMDSRSRRLRLAQLVGLQPDLRLLGDAATDRSCLRATIARRPELLVLAPAAGRASAAAHLIAGVRRGAPETMVLALIDAADRPVSLFAGELSADRFLAQAAPLGDVLGAVLDLARALRTAEAARGRRPGG